MQHFVPESTHELAEIAHWEEKSCYEKPVSTKETEDSCSFTQIKGESPLGYTPVEFLSLSRFWRVQLPSAEVQPSQTTYHIFPLNLAFYPKVPKLRLSGFCNRLCVEPFVRLPQGSGVKL